ncbi:hypothetical protein MMC29_002239, partial [Sticta canariensis]|nr:hypothetical protein [Sticta canariensis]
MDSSRHYQALLQLIDVSPQSHSACIGAKKTNQQCGCQVAAKSRNQAAQVLSTIARSSLTIQSIKRKMRLVAKLLLCKRFHQDQSTRLSSEWTDKIRSSRFTTHTSTLHAVLDESNGFWGAGQDDQYLRREHVVYRPREMLDSPTASTEDSELSVGTTRYQNLLQLIDVSPQSHSTCIGAKKTNQPCGCQVAAKSRNQAAQVLSTIARSSLTIQSIKRKMRLVAKLLLCKGFHQDQSTRLSSEWTDKLRSSRFTTHTSTLHAARDGNRGSQPAGQQDLVTAATEAPNLSVGTTAPRARRRRAPDTPFSMTLRSAASVTRESHQECPICRDGYGPRDHTVISCVQCQNVYHRDCAAEWRREHNTCPL